MSPKRKPKANVQEILNNPVRSTKQKGVKPKREGFLGWMTYLGWSMMLWMILLLELYANYDVHLPFPSAFIPVICGIAVLLFAKIWLNSSYRQSISFIERTLLAGITVSMAFAFILDVFMNFDGAIWFWCGCSWLLSVVVFRMMIKIRWAQFFKLYGIGVILFFVFVLDTIWNERYCSGIPYAFFGYYSYWIYAIGSYLYIFYKKSKDGYNKVWLKVFLFTLLPFLFLFSVRFELYEPYIGMGGLIGS